MKCPECRFDNPEGSKFCLECGSKIDRNCPQCGNKLPETAKFCNECGHDLAKGPKDDSQVDYSEPQSYTPKHLADKILTTRSSIEGERKLVTVLFADVANYTSICEKLDPEEVHQIMEGAFKILMDEIHKYEGTVNQFTGDGVMALFGAPVAHEDHAQRACLGALSILKSMGEYGDKIEKDTGVEFRMRIGLNSGPVIVGAIGDDLRMDYTAVGDTTNLGSRMESMAKPGTVLVSGNTHRLARDFFQFESLGKVEVKGKKAPQEAFELIKMGEVETRIGVSVAKGLTRFVGRKNSMSALMDAFDKVKSGSGQVVGLVGEAGVGKSRLLLEMRNALPQGEYSYLEGRCLQYGGSMTYLPVLDILRSYFDIKEGDREFLIKKKMEEKILNLDVKLKNVISPFQSLLSLRVDNVSFSKLEPKEKRERTFEALRDLIIRVSQERPLVLVVEDLHWMDKTSEEFLDYLIGWLANTPTMLLLLYRPEYTHPWGSRSYYTKVGLDQLGTNSSSELVKALLEEGEVASELSQLILNRAAGNPLFMEEFTQTLLENGSIERKEERYVLSPKASRIQVPDTIQGIISARLDRLEDNLKRTLQVASVIGREFAFRILQVITGMEEELKSNLINLQGLEFIYEKNLFPELEYIFKHALTQEVAYNSLLLKRRKEIHENIGKAIEELYSDRLDEFCEMLAYHYTRANDSIKALEYLRLAAEKASQGYAHMESLAWIQEAFGHTEHLPADERDSVCLDLVNHQARSLFFLGRRLDALECLREHEHRSQYLQAPDILSRYYYLFSLNYSYQGNREQAFRYAQYGLEEAKKAKDTVSMGAAYTIMSVEKWFAGPLHQSVTFAEQAVRLLEGTEKLDHLGRAYYILGLSTILHGDFGRAKEATKHLDEIGDLSENRRWKTNAACNLGWLSTMMGEWNKGIEYYHRALEYAPDPYEKAYIAGFLGFGYLEKGDHIKAVATLEQALEQATQYRSQQVQSWFKTYLGQAYGVNGQLDKAYDLVCQGLALAEGVKNLWGIGIAQHALGHVALLNGNYSESEIHFKEALDTCEATQARYQLARIHLDIAEFARAQSNQDIVETHLKNAYAWFKKLKVPKYADRAEQLARDYGVTIAGVELLE